MKQPASEMKIHIVLTGRGQMRGDQLPASVDAGIPFIDAAQWGVSGTLMVLKSPRTACLECIYPSVPPFEELFPVVGAISSTIGSLAALEAIKILSGTGEPLWGKMFSYDGYRGIPTVVSLTRNPECRCCQEAVETAGE